MFIQKSHDLKQTLSLRSGQSIFFRPKPIDISAVRRAGVGLDMDDEEYEDDPESGQPLIGDRSRVLFDAGSEQRPQFNATPMPRAVQATQERELEDVWAELG